MKTAFLPQQSTNKVENELSFFILIHDNSAESFYFYFLFNKQAIYIVISILRESWDLSMFTELYIPSAVYS